MKKIIMILLLCTLISASTPAVASAQSVNSNYEMKQNELKAAKEEAVHEIATITNLGSLSTNSQKFKEVANIIKQIDAAMNTEEIYTIMLNIAGTSANKEMVAVKTQVTQEIAELTNLGSMSSNSTDFKEIINILNEVNTSNSIEKIYTILDELKTEIKEKQELELAKTNAVQKIAKETNLGSLSSYSEEFKQVLNIIDQISNAVSIQEVEEILSTT